MVEDECDGRGCHCGGEGGLENNVEVEVSLKKDLFGISQSMELVKTKKKKDKKKKEVNKITKKKGGLGWVPLGEGEQFAQGGAL